MLSGLLGRKVGMTQIFGPTGAAVPVTVIEAGPCYVTQVKTEATDGYEAVQLGFGEAKVKNTTRPMLGHLGHTLPQTPTQRRKQQQESARARQKARQQAERKTDASATETEADIAETSGSGATSGKAQGGAKRRGGAGKALGPFRVLREVKVVGEYPAVGETVDVGMFRAGEEVDVIGTSKGKGFAGVMKRHGFRGGPRTHGQSDRSRAPGSIGPGTTPGRVLKGTRMAGRMGGERVTIKKLLVVQADPERNLLLVEGSVPGPNGGLLMIRKGADAMAVAARISAANASQRA